MSEEAKKLAAQLLEELSNSASSLLQEEKYKYGTTQVNLPSAHADFVIKWGREMIKDDDLYYDEEGGSGREKEPHITVLYGITEADPNDKVKELIKDTKPFTVRLLGISLFDDNPDYDVVKFEIESDELVNFANALRQICPNENKFPKYIPHATVAYVKKGRAVDLAGTLPFENDSAPITGEFDVNEILWKAKGDSEDPNRKELRLQLNRYKKESEDPKRIFKAAQGPMPGYDPDELLKLQTFLGDKAVTQVLVVRNPGASGWWLDITADQNKTHWGPLDSRSLEMARQMPELAAAEWIGEAESPKSVLKQLPRTDWVVAVMMTHFGRLKQAYYYATENSVMYVNDPQQASRFNSKEEAEKLAGLLVGRNIQKAWVEFIPPVQEAEDPKLAFKKIREHDWVVYSLYAGQTYYFRMERKWGDWSYTWTSYPLSASVFFDEAAAKHFRDRFFKPQDIKNHTIRIARRYAAMTDTDLHPELGEAENPKGILKQAAAARTPEDDLAEMGFKPVKPVELADACWERDNRNVRVRVRRFIGHDKTPYYLLDGFLLWHGVTDRYVWNHRWLPSLFTLPAIVATIENETRAAFAGVLQNLPEAEDPKKLRQLKRIRQPMPFISVPDGYYFRTPTYALVQKKLGHDEGRANAVTTDLDTVRGIKFPDDYWVAPPEWTIDDITSQPGRGERGWWESEDPKRFIKKLVRQDEVRIEWIDQHGREHSTAYYDVPEEAARSELDKNLVKNKSPYRCAKVIRVYSISHDATSNQKRWGYRVQPETEGPDDWKMIIYHWGSSVGSGYYPDRRQAEQHAQRIVAACQQLDRQHPYAESQWRHNAIWAWLQHHGVNLNEAEEPKKALRLAKDSKLLTPDKIRDAWRRIKAHYQGVRTFDDLSLAAASLRTGSPHEETIVNGIPQCEVCGAIQEGVPDPIYHPEYYWHSGLEKLLSEAKERAPFDSLNFPTDASVLAAKLLELDTDAKSALLRAGS